MSSERGRVILIFATVAVLAGAGGFYFFKVHRPKQVKQNAQDEIVAWEARFKAARDCLLGPKPGSSKTSEALAIREMAPDPWDRGRCTPLISKLSRGEAPDTGLPEVEAAWGELDKAASKAAAAFATHVGSSTTLKQDPLPAALDALDAARAKLRSIADLPASDKDGAPLQPAAILALSDGADPLVEVRVDSVPSAHGLLVFGKTATRDVQLALAAGGKPQVARTSSWSLRAVPDLSWGAQSAPDAIAMGAMDADGKIGSGSTVKLENASVAAAIGTVADGELVYGTATQLFVAHAKAGAFTPDPAVKIRAGQAAPDLDGRAAVVWQADGKPADPAVVWGQLLRPGADETPVQLGTGLGLGAMCLTKDRVYLRTGDQLVAFGGGKPVSSRTVGAEILIGCTADAVLLRAYDPRKPLMICTEDCRETAMPTGAPEFSATTVVGGKLVALASHGGVLGVWREGQAPVFFGLPEPADPVLAHEWPAMALTDGKSIDILARGAKTFVVIRIPAA